MYDAPHHIINECHVVVEWEGRVGLDHLIFSYLPTHVLRSAVLSYKVRCEETQLGRLNGRISNRAEIRAVNFEMQILFRFYPQNPKISINLFTGSCEWFRHDFEALIQLINLRTLFLNMGLISCNISSHLDVQTWLASMSQ